MKVMRLWLFIFSIAISGCFHKVAQPDIVKIVDFELSPDEDRVAFTALTPVGNTDIWVVDINGANLKKLTFRDRSPSNHIARFYKKHKWRNFFKIDIHSPQWTKEGRIAFSQELTKHHRWGIDTVSIRYWTIRPDGSDKRAMTDKDEIIRRKAFNPIHSFDLSDWSDKHKKKIFLQENTLWVLDEREGIPKKLIR